MSILVNFSVGNIKGTPGVISDTTAGKPAATAVAEGTIFVDQSLLTIEQSIGGVWQTISGGGGGAAGIDTVLSIGQALTANRNIDLASFDYTIFRNGTGGVAAFQISNLPTGYFYQFGETSNVGALIFDANSSFPIFRMNLNGNDFGIFAENDGSNRIFKIGDWNGIANGSSFQVDDNKQQIFSQFTGAPNWLLIDNNNLRSLIGDYAGLFNGAFLEVTDSVISANEGSVRNGFILDFPNDKITFGDPTLGNYLVLDWGLSQFYAINNTSQNGLRIEFDNFLFQFGDWQNQSGAGATYIEANASTSSATIWANAFNLHDNNGALISASASGSSGDHLVITINGTQYKIALLNP